MEFEVGDIIVRIGDMECWTVIGISNNSYFVKQGDCRMVLRKKTVEPFFVKVN